MQTGVLVEPFRRKRAKKNGPFGAVETVDKVVNLRDGKVGQPLAAPPLYGCCIPLAGEGCARETQEGIHRRLKPNSESYVSSVNASFVTFCSPMRSISALSMSPVASSASEPAVR